MLIGKLASESGFSRDTIRYYEKVGLIQCSEFDRQSNNYKNYSDDTLLRLTHIRELKAVGFTLNEITDLLDSFQQVGYPYSGLKAKMSGKNTKLNEKIKSLEGYRRSIQNIIDSCDSNCAIKDGLPNCIGGC